METLNIIVQLIVGAVLAGIYFMVKNALSELPKRIHNKNMEELKHIYELETEKERYGNSKNLQVENYFRQISGSEIEKVFSEWLEPLVDPKSYTEKENMNDMIKKAIMYGSRETVEKVATLQQFNFENQNKSGGMTEIDTYTMMYLIAFIAVQLKKDFTGYSLNPDDIIKCKIKDYYKADIKEKFRLGRENAEKIFAESHKE